MHDERLGMGKSVVINGELSASEDLTVEGCVEGKIQLSDHVLTVGSNARIKAQVTAKVIVVLGQVTGNLIATEKVDIRENGSVEGDITSPRVAIAEGAHFRGSVDMAAKGKQAQQQQPKAVGDNRPQPAPQPVAAQPPQTQTSGQGAQQGIRVGA